MATTSRSRTAAVKAEALVEHLPFEHAGHTYHVLPTSEWPFTALAAYEDGKVSTFIRLILPAEDYDAFLATSPKVADLEGFVLALQSALGISGN